MSVNKNQAKPYVPVGHWHVLEIMIHLTPFPTHIHTQTAADWYHSKFAFLQILVYKSNLHVTAKRSGSTSIAIYLMLIAEITFLINHATQAQPKFTKHIKGWL